MHAQDHLAIVRMRFVARAQIDTLNLHPDLCLRVLNEYGCNVVEIEPTTETQMGIIEANWPTPANLRTRYLGTLLQHLAARVLMLTAKEDAAIAARALTPDA